MDVGRRNKEDVGVSEGGRGPLMTPIAKLFLAEGGGWRSLSAFPSSAPKVTMRGHHQSAQQQQLGGRRGSWSDTVSESDQRSVISATSSNASSVCSENGLLVDFPQRQYDDCSAAGEAIEEQDEGAFPEVPDQEDDPDDEVPPDGDLYVDFPSRSLYSHVEVEDETDEENVLESESQFGDDYGPPPWVTAPPASLEDDDCKSLRSMYSTATYGVEDDCVSVTSEAVKRQTNRSMSMASGAESIQLYVPASNLTSHEKRPWRRRKSTSSFSLEEELALGLKSNINNNARESNRWKQHHASTRPDIIETPPGENTELELESAMNALRRANDEAQKDAAIESSHEDSNLPTVIQTSACDSSLHLNGVYDDDDDDDDMWNGRLGGQEDMMIDVDLADEGSPIDCSPASPQTPNTSLDTSSRSVASTSMHKKFEESWRSFAFTSRNKSSEDSKGKLDASSSSKSSRFGEKNRFSFLLPLRG